MPEDTDFPNGWMPPNSPDPGGDLLQRSLDHVEKLLARLEYGPTPGGGGGVTAPATAPHDDPPDEAKQIGERLLNDARREAEAVARQLLSEANSEAARIRADAEREAQDTLSAARARAKQEWALAEGRAAERLDAAEHEALQLRRAAWTSARIDTVRDGVRRPSGAATAQPCAPDLLAPALENMREALFAVDRLATVLASGSAELTAAADALRAVIDAPPVEKKARGTNSHNGRWPHAESASSGSLTPGARL